MITLTALLIMAGAAQAMSYEQARDQALFLTDKMAYELNLTEDQYEAAYEINLDYLMSVESVDDLYGLYWERRNLDLSYILLDWQYRAYLDARYFYRPLYWEAGYWHFGIYARYPYRTYFYFGRPHFYMTYHGGHSWRMNGGRSWYHGRVFGNGHRHGTNNHGFGMRNGFDRGDYHTRGGHFERPTGGKGLERKGDGGPHGGNVGGDRNGRGSQHGGNVGGGNGGSRNGSFGSRPSSTRQGTGSHNGKTGGNDRGSFSKPNRSFQPSKAGTRTPGSVERSTSHPSPATTSGTMSRPSSSMGSTPTRHSSSAGSVSRSSTPTRSSSVSRSSGSSHSGSSHSSGSHTGGSHSGGGSHGGGHFGGHR